MQQKQRLRRQTTWRPEKKPLEAAKAQYDATLAALNADYDMFEEAEQTIITQTTKEINEAATQFNEEIQRWDAYIKAKNPAPDAD